MHLGTSCQDVSLEFGISLSNPDDYVDHYLNNSDVQTLYGPFFTYHKLRTMSIIPTFNIITYYYQSFVQG